MSASSSATNRPSLSSKEPGAIRRRMRFSRMHSTADSASLTAYRAPEWSRPWCRPVVPDVSAWRSTSTTRRPRSARSWAMAPPVPPPPTITTWGAFHASISIELRLARGGPRVESRSDRPAGPDGNVSGPRGPSVGRGGSLGAVAGAVRLRAGSPPGGASGRRSRSRSASGRSRSRRPRRVAPGRPDLLEQRRRRRPSRSSYFSLLQAVRARRCRSSRGPCRAPGGRARARTGRAPAARSRGSAAGTGAWYGRSSSSRPKPVSRRPCSWRSSRNSQMSHVGLRRRPSCRRRRMSSISSYSALSVWVHEVEVPDDPVAAPGVVGEDVVVRLQARSRASS